MRHATALMFLAAVLWSAEASAEWTQQYEIFGSGNSIAAVAAGSGEAAVAFGMENTTGQTQPVLLRTIDGGGNWMKVSPPGQFAMFMTISMPDDKFVYAGGLGLFQSKDGGNSYTEIKLPGGGGMFDLIALSRVQAVDPVHVFAVGGKKLYWTPNSLQWEATTMAADVDLAALFFLGAHTGWFGGGKAVEITETDPETGQEVVVGYDYQPMGMVMRTDDGGKTFDPLVIGSEDYFRHLAFIDETIGLAVVSNNSTPYAIKRTTDGGKSWVPVALPQHDSGFPLILLTRIVMTSPFEGWVAGCAGQEGVEIDNLGNAAVVLRTMDGGATWKFDPAGESKGGYFDLDFAGPHWGWAVGTFGHIMAYTDGTPWVPPEENPEPAGDVAPQPGQDGTSEVGAGDVWGWGQLFGVLGDEVLVGENSRPGNGGKIPVGEDPTCTTETQSGGCAAAAAPSSGMALVIVLLAVLALALALARVVPRRRGWLFVLTAVLLVGCAEEKTVTVCEETTSSLPQLKEDVGPAGEEESSSVPLEFHCGLTTGQEPMAFAAAGGRATGTNDLVVFVRKAKDGGSDLFLAAPDGSGTAPLTGFADPAVNVWHPAWSPDRKAVAFVSDYRAEFNDKRRNVFVVALEGGLCYQLTPGIEEARPHEGGELTATVTGSFKYGQGAVVTPVAGATVGYSGAMQTSLTGVGGEFSVKAAPGQGKIVMRGTVNGMQVKGVAPFEVAAGESKDVGQVLAFVEAEYLLGPLSWSSAGDRLFAFVSEQLDTAVAIDVAKGQPEPWLEKQDDTLVLFQPFPDADMALVAYNSDPTHYLVVSMAAPEEVLYEFTFGGQSRESRVAFSPQRIMATTQEERLVLFGANAAGGLENADVTPDAMAGFADGQIDWSLSGTLLVVTRKGTKGTDLVVVDVNTRQAAPLTADGASSMPAWFGR
jgi:photosystem II stability/assembly factor-like uncharacterized protein